MLIYSIKKKCVWNRIVLLKVEEKVLIIIINQSTLGK